SQRGGTRVAHDPRRAAELRPVCCRGSVTPRRRRICSTRSAQAPTSTCSARSQHGGQTSPARHSTGTRTSNVLGSPSGPLWRDFETACQGPREYDLAALKEDALAAYGPYDGELVDAMRPLYLAWVTASMMIALPRRP